MLLVRQHYVFLTKQYLKACHHPKPSGFNRNPPSQRIQKVFRLSTSVTNTQKEFYRKAITQIVVNGIGSLKNIACNMGKVQKNIFQHNCYRKRIVAINLDRFLNCLQSFHDTVHCFNYSSKFLHGGSTFWLVRWP